MVNSAADEEQSICLEAPADGKGTFNSDGK